MFSSRALGRAKVAAAVAATALVLSACGSSDEAGSTPAATTTAGATTASDAVTVDGSPESSETAGATGGETTGGSQAAGEPGIVTITVTEADGCVASPDTVPAGPITFNVTNVDAAGVTEVEVVSEQRIRGERENLAPGFDASFSVKLDGGSYEVYCPGATTERQPFTVTGEAAVTTGNIADLLQQATVDYAAYIDDQTGFLVDATKPLVAAIKAGNLEEAQKAYATARVFYERIEPVAESFGDLDPAIDLRIGDVEAGVEWTGFHPIEKALFEGKTTKGLDKLADKLMADILDLQARAKELGANTSADTKGADRYKPDEVANGAVGLLAEVQQSKISGEEEAYSRIDLLDFEANVEGSTQAFAVLRPALDEIDPELAKNISTKFDTLQALLATHKDPKQIGGYTLFPDLSDKDLKALADALAAVAEPLAKISGKIATA
ncbi:hypothetical protein D1871_01630 [Nakamurella silvestris]|nr:hypothetical protein D1871_01630 [Nakamurella silvestris]